MPPAGTAPRGDDDVVVVDGDTAPLPTATAALPLDLLEPHPMISNKPKGSSSGGQEPAKTRFGNIIFGKPVFLSLLPGWSVSLDKHNTTRMRSR